MGCELSTALATNRQAQQQQTTKRGSGQVSEDVPVVVADELLDFSCSVPEDRDDTLPPPTPAHLRPWLSRSDEQGEGQPNLLPKSLVPLGSGDITADGPCSHIIPNSKTSGESGSSQHIIRNPFTPLQSGAPPPIDTTPVEEEEDCPYQTKTPVTKTPSHRQDTLEGESFHADETKVYDPESSTLGEVPPTIDFGPAPGASTLFPPPGKTPIKHRGDSLISFEEQQQPQRLIGVNGLGNKHHRQMSRSSTSDSSFRWSNNSGHFARSASPLLYPSEAAESLNKKLHDASRFRVRKQQSTYVQFFNDNFMLVKESVPGQLPFSSAISKPLCPDPTLYPETQQGRTDLQHSEILTGASARGAGLLWPVPRSMLSARAGGGRSTQSQCHFVIANQNLDLAVDASMDDDQRISGSVQSMSGSHCGSINDSQSSSALDALWLLGNMGGEGHFVLLPMYALVDAVPVSGVSEKDLKAERRAASRHILESLDRMLQGLNTGAHDEVRRFAQRSQQAAERTGLQRLESIFTQLLCFLRDIKCLNEDPAAFFELLPASPGGVQYTNDFLASHGVGPEDTYGGEPLSVSQLATRLLHDASYCVFAAARAASRRASGKRSKTTSIGNRPVQWIRRLDGKLMVNPLFIK